MMAEVEVSDVNFGYGTMSFLRGKERVPASVIREGNVTTHNAEVPGRPDSFDVSFQLSFKAEANGLSQFNVFTLRFPITDKPADTPYSEIEREAVHLLAPILRIVADHIEQEISDNEGGDPAPEEPEA